MTQYVQWVNWRYELDGAGKPTKTPYNPTSGKHASSTNTKTWNSFQTVVAAMATGHYSGIGFVLASSDPYTIIDLDDPYKDDATEEEALETRTRHGKVIGMMDTYTEWSPSGKGMHVVVRGRVQTGRRRGKIEVYSTERYMTMTGNVYHNADIKDRNDLLQELWADLGPPESKTDFVVREEAQKHTDLEIYNIAINAKNGDKFYKLWQGNFQDAGYPTQSQADFALVNMLGLYSRNWAQIERMFLSSGLGYRIVSGQKRKSRKYVPDMIRRSFDNQEPDIDITQLVAKAELQFSKRVHVTQPAVPALEWDMPPGLLGDIVRFIYAAAPLQVKEVALAGALGLLAGIVGRYYNVSDEGLNLYLLVLAPTGTGKEAAARGISKLMGAVEKLVPAASSFRGPAEIASGPALTKYLTDTSPCCLSILGEFGLRLHQLCDPNAQSHMVGIKRLLLDLFHKSGKSGQIQPHIYSDKAKNTEVLFSPNFTMLGESTPETFYRYLDDSMVSDGLLPRFACIEYTGKRGELNRKHTEVKPDADLVQRMADLANNCLGMAANKRVIDCMYTPEAHDVYYSLASHYTKLINDDSDNEVTRQFYNRAHIKVMKLAGLIAVGVNPIYPVITVEYIEWGRNLVERDITNIIHKFQSGKVGRETGEANQVGEVANCIKEYLFKPYGPTMAKALVDEAMHKSHVIPHSYISRQCSARAAFRLDKMGSSFAIRRALNSLQHDGVIREVKEHLLFEQFGKRMQAYIVTEMDAFTK